MSAKRQQLIDTAERLFYRDGYHATGVDRVIAEAGIARMTLYNHFASKEDLVRAALVQRSETYLAFLDEAVATTGGEPGKLARALLAAHARWLSSVGDRGCMFMKAIGEYREHEPAIAELARSHKGEVVDRIRRHVDLPGNEACRWAESLLLILEGMTTMAQIRSVETVSDNARGLLDAWLQQSRQRQSPDEGG